MSYTSTIWNDRVVEVGKENEFKITENGVEKIVEIEKTGIEIEGTKVKADKLNNIQTGIEQNNLFNLLLTPDKYKLTEFDTPTVGSITESIKLKSDNTVYATITTEFDTPTAGSITTTLVCAELGINNKVVVEFNVDGSITETGSEVV